MATTLSVNSNYAGEVAGAIIGEAYKEADTIAKEVVTVLPDIPDQISIRKIQYSNGITDYTCGFNAGGGVTLSERVLAPKKLKNENEICKEDLRQIWNSARMGFSAHNDQMHPEVEEALLAEILKNVATDTGTKIWTGTATTGSFPGFIPLFEADADVIDITAIAGAFTKANVLEEIEKVLNATPDDIFEKEGSQLLVSTDISRAYTQLMVSSGITSGFGGGNFPLFYGDTQLVTLKDLPAKTMIYCQKQNLFFGTGLLSDHNEIRIKDMDESDLSGIVRYKMVYTAGVQYAWGGEVVLYNP